LIIEITSSERRDGELRSSHRTVLGLCKTLEKQSNPSSSRSVRSTQAPRRSRENQSPCLEDAQSWDGSSSGQLGKSPLWWESKPSPQARRCLMEMGAGQASRTAEAARKATIKPLCHEPCGGGGGSESGATALPV